MGATAITAAGAALLSAGVTAGQSSPVPSSPRWSPTGDAIVYSGTADGHTDIFLRPLDGASARRLTDDEVSDHGPEFTPDGRGIVFHSGKDGRFDICVMNIDGTGRPRSRPAAPTRATRTSHPTGGASPSHPIATATMRSTSWTRTAPARRA